jgi:dTDP-4-dehydrorhamnose 3,5-epimerase
MTELQVDPGGTLDAPTVDEDGRKRGRIDGVVSARLNPHVDHRGSLYEIVNFDHPFWEEAVVYAYAVTIRPGRIKGWGMHKVQSDRYLVVHGSVRVALYDGRAGSATQGLVEEHYLTEALPTLLLIPPGVWHADQNWGDDDALILNFPTQPYDRESPDKYRIDPHSGEIPFDWSLPDG